MFTKVYHISAIKNRDKILKEGLIPKGCNDKECKYKGLNYSPRICISLKKDDVYAKDWVSHEGVDIWKFTVLKRNLKPDKVSGEKSHFFLEHSIPKGCLRISKTLPFFKRNFNEPSHLI